MNINVGVLLRMKSEMLMGIRSLSASNIQTVSPPLLTSLDVRSSRGSQTTLELHAREFGNSLLHNFLK